MVRVAAAGQARERSGKDMSSKEKEKRDFPRNIRQIGDPGKEKRIYLEDYAVAYLREVKGAVLFGELVRVVIQNFLKTIVVQFVFEVIG